MNKKELMEKINDLQEKMTSIVSKAQSENRELNEDEVAQFEAAEAEAKSAQTSLDAIEKVEAMKPVQVAVPENLTPEQKDIKVFEQLIRTGDINQSPTDMEKGDNGAVIPASIANKIIDKIVEIRPL